MAPEQHASFVGSIPELYDRYLAPTFIEPYARDLASRVRVPAGGRLLELACGTGRLTRLLVAALGSAVTIDATDLNDAMTAVARERVASPNVCWGTADASSLPFDAAAFDAAVCQFGVMFFPDKIGAAGQVRRVLKPGASYWLNTWSSLADNPVARVGNEAIARFFDGEPPGFLNIPFGYHDRDRIAADLRAGGFGTVEIEAIDLEAGSESAEHLAVGLVQGSPMVAEIRARARATPGAVTAAVADALAREFGATPLRSTMRALVVRARE